jgi:transcriptional/translational regulatory protein YebC/TACO1
MFDRLGQIVYGLEAGSADKVMEAAIEAGAEDVETEEGGEDDEPARHVIFSAFEDLNTVALALEASLGPARSTGIVWRPKTLAPVGGDAAAALLKLLEALDEDEDVQGVYGNYEISEEELSRLAG